MKDDRNHRIFTVESPKSEDLKYLRLNDGLERLRDSQNSCGLIGFLISFKLID